MRTLLLAPFAVLASACNYVSFLLEDGGEPLVLQPIDFVGEHPLGRGHFTYEIGMSGEYPAIEAVRD